MFAIVASAGTQPPIAPKYMYGLSSNTKRSDSSRTIIIASMTVITCSQSALKKELEGQKIFIIRITLLIETMLADDLATKLHKKTPNLTKSLIGEGSRLPFFKERSCNKDDKNRN